MEHVSDSEFVRWYETLGEVEINIRAENGNPTLTMDGVKVCAMQLDTGGPVEALEVSYFSHNDVLSKIHILGIFRIELTEAFMRKGNFELIAMAEMMTMAQDKLIEQHREELIEMLSGLEGWDGVKEFYEARTEASPCDDCEDTSCSSHPRFEPENVMFKA